MLAWQENFICAPFVFFRNCTFEKFELCLYSSSGAIFTPTYFCIFRSSLIFNSNYLEQPEYICHHDGHPWEGRPDHAGHRLIAALGGRRAFGIVLLQGKKGRIRLVCRRHFLYRSQIDFLTLWKPFFILSPPFCGSLDFRQLVPLLGPAKRMENHRQRKLCKTALLNRLRKWFLITHKVSCYPKFKGNTMPPPVGVVPNLKWCFVSPRFPPSVLARSW